MIMLSRDNLVGYAFVREGRGLLKQVVTSHDSEKQSAIWRVLVHGAQNVDFWKQLETVSV